MVITGTGAQTKLTQTGAITTVNVDHLKANPSSSIVNTLAGNVAGVLAMQTSGQPGKMYLSFGFVEFRLLVQVLARMSWLMASNAVWMKSI